MSHIKNTKIRLIIYVFVFTSVFSFQAYSSDLYFKKSSDNKFIQEEVNHKATAKKQIESIKTKIGRRVQYDQWVLKCAEGLVFGAEKCNLIHQINSKTNKQILKIEVLKVSNGEIMLFHVPLGIYLPAGVKLIMGESEYMMPVTTCLISGCQAMISLDLSLNQKILHKKKATVQLLHVDQTKKINIEFSLVICLH